MNGADRRVRFADGLLLAAADLGDDRGYEARMRGLHTRAVHATWGISLGLDLKPVESELGLSPGLAHDCHGRELVLSQGFQVPLPDDLGDDGMVLVIRHDDEPTRPPSDIGAVRVGAPGVYGDTDPRLDRPLLAWRRLDDVAWGEEVPLGLVVTFGDNKTVAVNNTCRVYVQALERPHVGFGTRVLTRPDGDTHAFGSWQAITWTWTIATDEGGFIATPDYFAVPSPDWTAGVDTEMAGALVAVDTPTPTSFGLTLTALYLKAATASAAARAGGPPFELTWFGLEDRRGCPPTPWAWLLNVDWMLPVDVVAHILGVADLGGGV